MPYVRTRGNQLAVVHGEREPGTGRVEQRILFTIYSKAEALEILGRGSSGGTARFEGLLEREFPELRFNWKRIHGDIEKNLALLPDQYEYAAGRVEQRFRKSLCAFTRTLIQADPQELFPAARVLQQHRHELECVADLIHWRLKLHDQKPSEPNADSAFYRRFAFQGRDVPPDTEEHAAGFYERREYEKAEAIFRLLIDCFRDWAEGYNYLGLIAYHQYKLDQAAAHFEKTVQLGRKLFPMRLARKWYWRDHRTRPYIRGLRNLTLTLNEIGRYEDALKLCARLVEECGDDLTAVAFQAAIFLNTGLWKPAVDAAQRAGGEVNPSAGFIEALAQFELGQTEESLALFLGAALHYPRAARMLVGLRTPQPTSADEARDHNGGVSTRRTVYAYLKHQSRGSKRFFSGLVSDPRVARLLDESITVVHRWQQDRSADRSVFDRMKLMQSRAFARSEAHKLRDLVPATHHAVSLQ